MIRIEIPPNPNYHFMTDMTDKAIDWIEYQKSLTPDKPFFIYFAPGATHAPHHVPKEWIAKYKGKFDQGWDKLREETLARQKKLGVVPPDTKLAPKPEAIKDWDKLSADEKKLFARQMEVFAGFGEYADHEIGRLIEAIEDMGQLDNTLIFYIVGDNGASAEGGMNGLFNEYDLFQRRAGDGRGHPEALSTSSAARCPTLITPPAGPWRAIRPSPGRSRSPASYGGTRNGMVVHWPKRHQGEGRGARRSGITSSTSRRRSSKRPVCPSRSVVNGTPQTPIEGVSMVYTFDDPGATSRHTTQYFEIFGNRGDLPRRLAGRHGPPGAVGIEPRATFEDDKWELYDTRSDFSLANDLAGQEPGEAQGNAGSLPEGSGQEPCAADR